MSSPPPPVYADAPPASDEPPAVFDDAPPPDAIGDTEAQYADQDPAALTDFRATLEPYGSWADDPTYGTVWVPSADATGDGFTPYVSSGHWEYDQDEYVWASDYAWGWAPFHYGRWVNSGFGWAWIPGRTYAGAWVSWRTGQQGGGYVGWAPLAPTWGWRGGVAFRSAFAPRQTYAFVPVRELFDPRVQTRLVRGPQAMRIALQSQPWQAPQGRAHAGGPSPAALGLPASEVVRASFATPGLREARTYARPDEAVPAGARRPSPYARPDGRVGPWHRDGVAEPMASHGQSPPDHFGGRFGGGFAGGAPFSRPAPQPAMRRPVPLYVPSSAPQPAMRRPVPLYPSSGYPRGAVPGPGPARLAAPGYGPSERPTPEVGARPVFPSAPAMPDPMPRAAVPAAPVAPSPAPARAPSTAVHFNAGGGGHTGGRR